MSDCCLMQRTVFSAFKKFHFESQNVFKVLETWGELLLSVCHFKYLCYACHFSVLAIGKKTVNHNLSEPDWLECHALPAFRIRWGTTRACSDQTIHAVDVCFVLILWKSWAWISGICPIVSTPEYNIWLTVMEYNYKKHIYSIPLLQEPQYWGTLLEYFHYPLHYTFTHLHFRGKLLIPLHLFVTSVTSYFADHMLHRSKV